MKRFRFFSIMALLALAFSWTSCSDDIPEPAPPQVIHTTEFGYIEIQQLTEKLRPGAEQEVFRITFNGFPEFLVEEFDFWVELTTGLNLFDFIYQVRLMDEMTGEVMIDEDEDFYLEEYHADFEPETELDGGQRSFTVLVQTQNFETANSVEFEMETDLGLPEIDGLSGSIEHDGGSMFPLEFDLVP